MKPLLQIIYDKLLFDGIIKSQSDLSEKIGKTNSYVSQLRKSMEVLPEKVQYKLTEVFGISKEYLESNGEKGSMFGTTPERQHNKRIPLIGEGAAATDMQINVQDANYIDDYIDVGDLLSDSEAAFTVYGNSMAPAYSSGVILGIRRNLDNFIQPGELYLLVTKSNRIFKRLYYTPDKLSFICYSENTMTFDSGPLKGKHCYEPFEVNLTEVLHIYDITGMIKRTRNSGIISRQK